MDFERFRRKESSEYYIDRYKTVAILDNVVIYLHHFTHPRVSALHALAA
jgi:hypothetical protein